MECTKQFLDSIDPKKSGNKYSVNIRKHLARYKGVELPSVYRTTSELGAIIGSNSLIVGSYENGWIHGKRIIKIMGNSRTPGYAYMPGCFKIL